MEKTYKVLYSNNPNTRIDTIIIKEDDIKVDHIKVNSKDTDRVKAELNSKGYKDVDNDKYKDIAKMVVDYYPKKVKL